MILLMTASVARGIPINGSFETGNLSGWNVTIEGAHYWDDENNFIDINELPFSIFDAVPYFMPRIESDHFYNSVHGNYYLEIPGNPASDFPFYFEGNLYVADLTHSSISVSQNLFINTGDILSGWAALWTYDYPPYNYDRAVVELSNSAITDQAIQITVQDAYGEIWPGGSDPQNSPWTYWTWTAPSSGMYTLSLKNRMDDQENSIACFDGIQLYSVHAVPEPSTMFTLGFSLIVLLGIGRKKFKSR